MTNLLSIYLGKLIIVFSRFLNLGSGSTWPGHIALKLNPNFISRMLDSYPKGVKPKIVIIAGTNGKTTTGKLITEILRTNHRTVLHNPAGANLLNGLASTIIKGASLFSFPRPGLGKLKNSSIFLLQIKSLCFFEFLFCINSSPHYSSTFNNSYFFFIFNSKSN